MLPGEWHHVEPAERTKSDLYRDVLPLINSRTVALLDNPVLQQQLVALERRTSRAGKDSIDHPPGGRDDVANAASVLVLTGERMSCAQFQSRNSLPDYRHCAPVSIHA
jgi:hypothetical protein